MSNENYVGKHEKTAEPNETTYVPKHLSHPEKTLEDPNPYGVDLDSEHQDRDFREWTPGAIPKSVDLIGEKTIRAAQYYHEARERAREAAAGQQTHGFPESLKEFVRNKSLEYLNKKIVDYNELMENPEVIEQEFREPLLGLPELVKRRQNRLFSEIAIHNGRRSRFINDMFKPEKIDLKEYDYIGRLGEKDENGEYILDSRQVGNFMQWYYGNLAGLEAGWRQDCLYNNERILKENVERLTNPSGGKRQLPESYVTRINKLLDKKSPDFIDVKFRLFDPASDYFAKNSNDASYISEKWGHYRHDLGKPKRALSEIAIAPELYFDNFPEREMRTALHELTHAISGEPIEFGGHKEAERIFNEAMTEHIGSLIFQCGETLSLNGLTAEEAYRSAYGDPKEADAEIMAYLDKKMNEMKIMRIEANTPGFGNGYTYKAERGVLKYLQRGGQKVIDPMIFYEAYIEDDVPREKLRKEGKYYEGKPKGPDRTYGPAQTRLIQELLEAWPGCKNTRDLGELIERTYALAQ
ncbi:hypothetical protein IJI17_02415 [Candidatus Saccharibacteria bacterium]|nr:hypothetical protein [Candidatus Saccharibacteria bacterium]